MNADRQLDVLIADDEAPTLEVLGAVLEAQGFLVRLARTPEDAFRILRDHEVDAVVTDVMFEGRPAGEEILAATRDLRPDAVCVLMTGYPRVEAAVQAMKVGATDYVTKPVEPVELATTIRRAVNEKRLAREELPFHDLVDVLSGLVSKSIERVDPYTAGHGERTRHYCKLVAEDFGLDAKTIERLELAAIAHDYGKIFLDDLGFLTKKGPLTPDERREMQRHPLVGAERPRDPSPARAGRPVRRGAPRTLGWARLPLPSEGLGDLQARQDPVRGGGLRLAHDAPLLQERVVPREDDGLLRVPGGPRLRARHPRHVPPPPR